MVRESDKSGVLILGASGQVGRALKALLGDDAVLLSREQADLSHPELLEKALSSYTPAAIINAAAYTAVDKAEEEESLATAINGTAPGILAEICKKRDIPLIHYSTDYVFPGNKDGEWNEDDQPSPINAYGRSKLAGEEAIRQCGGKWLVFRTSWVYDEQGKNFFNTMLRLGREREQISVVSDQVGNPTYAPALALATMQILEAALAMREFPSGIYHLCGTGSCSWYDFANAIFSRMKAKAVPLKIEQVNAISSEQYPTPAKRPQNSRLNGAKVKQVFNVTLPSWQQSLDKCVEQKYECLIL